MQMLTEPMTAADRAAAKQDREAWDAMEAELRATKAERQRAQEACEQMGRRITKLETALGNLVRFDRGDAAIARGNYQNLMAEACEALGGHWKP